MNRLLKSALIELRGDGVNLDPVADLEHLLTLDKLASDVMDTPPAIADAVLFRREKRVGNVTLRRLSIGAQYFINEVVLGWFPGDLEWQDLSYAYVMVHCGHPEKLWALQDNRKAFEREVKAWARTLDVTRPELIKAIREFLKDERDEVRRPPRASEYREAVALVDKLRKMPEPYRTECMAAVAAMQVEQDHAPDDCGQLIEILCREYKTSPEAWVWLTSRADCELLAHWLSEHKNAEMREINGAQDDRMQRAHYAFRQYVDMVRKLKKGVK